MLNYYRNARTYELFIRKTYNCKKGKQHGADESLMVQLFLNELPNYNIKKLRIPPERQVFKIKLYIEKALTTLSKRKRYINSIEHFMPLLFKLDRAKSPEDLVKIVNASLAKIIEIENESRRSA